DVLSINTVIGGDLSAEIFAADGTKLSGRVSVLPSGLDQQVQLPSDGEYKLVFKSAFDGAHLPSYAFVLDEIPADDVEPIAYREIAVGAIERAGARDQWFFDGNAGDNIFVDFLDLSGGDLQVTLTAPNGSVLSSRSFSQEYGHDFELILSETGTYTITTQAAFGANTLHEYRFQIWDIPPEEPQFTLLNVPIAGQLLPGQQQRFLFEAVSGSQLLLDALETQAASLSIQITNPDGSLLTQRLTQDQLVSLGQTGTYLATIGRTSDAVTALDAQGPFEFRLQDVTYRAGGALDSRGTRFYLAFPRNLREFLGSNSPEFSLAITSQVQTSGAVMIPGLDWFTTFDLNPGQAETISLPAAVELFENDRIFDRGIIVATVDEVAVYGLNQMPLSTDGYTALPVDALGTEHVVLSYPNTVRLLVDGGSSLGVVATQDDTQITILPAIEVNGHPAGVPFTVVLDEAQAYQLYASAADAANLKDLSGTQITSSSPVAVLGGNTAAYVPAGFAAADHLIEQLPATNTWGSNFLTVPLATRTAGDTLRVLAANDNTDIYINNEFVGSLGAGEVFETVANVASHLRTSQPALVAQYSHSSSFDGVTSDPFMMLVTPVEQYQSDYTLTTPLTGIDVNFANIVVPLAEVANVVLDGQLLASSSFNRIGDTEFAAATIPISVGSHSFSAPQPFSVSVYGFDEFESYGYFGGMRLAPLARADRLSLSPVTSSLALNTLQTLSAEVLDADGFGIPGQRVEFAIVGVNARQLFAITDEFGVASIQYTSMVSGTDTITASLSGLTATAVVDWQASPPSLLIQDPLSEQILKVGKYLLQGEAAATLSGVQIVEVLVNDLPVDVIDAAGRFFANIDVAEGVQSYTIRTTDSLGQQTEASLAVVGVAESASSLFRNTSLDVTASVGLEYTATTFNRQSNQLSAQLGLSNLGNRVLGLPLAARLDATNSARVQLANADATTNDQRPIKWFIGETETSEFIAGSSTEKQRLLFDNPEREQILPEFSILTQANSPPQILSSPVVEAIVGKDYRYALLAVDDSTQQLQYQLLQAPDTMTVDPQTGEIFWFAGFADQGVHAIVLQVTDSQGAVAEQAFTLLVSDAPGNRPPRFTTAPRTTIEPGTSYEYQAQAVDADGDRLEYVLLSSPAGMVLDAAGGVLSWENPEVGSHSIQLQVVDGRGSAAEQSFTLSVGELQGQSPPQFQSIPQVTGVVGALYVYTPRVQDQSGTQLNYSLLIAPPGMQIDSGSGRITWRTDIADVGTHAVRLRAENELGSFAVQAYELQISAAPANQPPLFVSSPNLVATVDQVYTYQATAVDTATDSPSYELLVGPAGMSLDPLNGQLTWSPSSQQLGSQRVLLAAVDALGAKAYQQFYVSVRDGNSPPSFLSDPPTSIQAGDAYRYDPQVFDSQDRVRFQLVSGPASNGGMQIDPASGSVTWQPGVMEVGQHPVTLQATDERGASSIQQFVLTVLPDNEPPLLEILLDAPQVDLNETATISLLAVDNLAIGNLELLADGLPLSLIQGMATFSSSETGYVFLTAVATDTSGNTTTRYATLQVGNIDDTTPPEVRIESPAHLDVVTYLTDVFATVTDEYLAGYRLEYSRLNENTWQTLAEVAVTDGTPLDVVNGRIAVLDPTLLLNDQYELRLTAEDLQGNKAFDTAIISLDGQAKIGTFELAFTDLSIPLAGIPIEIGRTYSTLHADNSMDFGFGWKLDVASPRIRETTRISAAEAAGGGPFAANPFRLGSRVYLNAPDGRRVGFTFDPVPEAGLLGTIWRPRFLPDPGVYHQLEVANTPLSQAEDGTFGLYLTGFPYNPDTYTLVTKDQHRYTYQQFADMPLQSIKDRNGVELVFDETGIHSSVGPEILWVRDAAGRIQHIIDPAGNRLEYTYDAQGDLRSVTDQVGITWTMQYAAQHSHFLESVIDSRGEVVHRLEFDADGRLTSSADGLGNAATARYDLPSNQEIVADRLGNETTLTFDDRGNVIEEVTPVGDSTRYVYDDRDNQIAMVDGRGFTTQYEYDALGNVTRKVNALGDTWITEYNEFNDPVRIIDELGRVRSAEYDALGNLIAVTDSTGAVQRFERDFAGRATRLTDFSGFETSLAYGNSGPERVVDPLGGVQSITYSPIGLPVFLVDQNGHERHLHYDAAGRLLTVTDHLGGVIQLGYETQSDELLSGEGEQQAGRMREFRPTSITDELGRVTRFEYDANYRMTRMIAADGSDYRWVYDANGNVIETVDELGRVTRFGYRGDQRLQSITDPLGAIITLDYDAAGNLSSITDALGESLVLEYDPLNRLVSVSDSLGSLGTRSYDAVGNVLSFTDPLGRQYRFAYDAKDRLVSVVNPNAEQTLLTYDAMNNLTSLTDPLGNVTRFVYDGNLRLVAELDPAF
ncbi:MAG: putative Ig domain-containing protein, partial [bacterium]|nr:putative Ig domain-containing protein [bacterium]